MTKRLKHRPNTAQFNLPHLTVQYDQKRMKVNGESSVNIVFYFHQQRFRFPTGVSVTLADWDCDNLKVKKSNKRYADFNLIIENQKAKLNDLLVKVKLSGMPLDIEKLKEAYEKPEYIFDFIDFMQNAINSRKGIIANSTVNQHNGILSKLKAYKDPIYSNHLTEEFFNGYAKYLKQTLKNDMNTRHGNFKTIRAYLRMAMDKGLLSVMPMAKNPVNQTMGKRTFLTDAELRSMIDLYRKGTLSESRQSVLRWFLFSCFTGLRISDLRRITMDDIAGDLLIITPYKTKNVSGKTIKIPLKDMAKQLIIDEGEKRIDGLVFNCIAEQNMREYIKLIAKNELKIKKDMSWHTSRHTFATVFLRNTNNLAALQKILGHSNIRETMIYAHTMTEDVMDAMDFQNGY